MRRDMQIGNIPGMVIRTGCNCLGIMSQSVSVASMRKWYCEAHGD